VKSERMGILVVIVAVSLGTNFVVFGIENIKKSIRKQITIDDHVDQTTKTKKGN